MMLRFKNKRRYKQCAFTGECPFFIAPWLPSTGSYPGTDHLLIDSMLHLNRETRNIKKKHYYHKIMQCFVCQAASGILVSNCASIAKVPRQAMCQPPNGLRGFSQVSVHSIFLRPHAATRLQTCITSGLWFLNSLGVQPV